MATVPRSGMARPMMWRSSTLLPQPERPMITMVSPVWISSSTPSRTFLRP